jgi:succinate dehydrogenase / fumarate reductase, cytochrome b subunit
MRMPTPDLTPAARFGRYSPIRLASSSVGCKALAAGSGLLLGLWVVLHMLGNLGAFAGPLALDGYAAGWRRTGPLLLLMRVGLGAMALTHVAAVALLVRRARTARPERYVHARWRAATLSSRSMRVSGLLVLAFIVLHVLHMTLGTLHPWFAAGSVYHNLLTGLAPPPIALAYIAGALLVGLHLAHGLFAAPRALGVGEGRSGLLGRRVALALGLAIAAGFSLVPLAVLAGVLR